MYAKMKRSYIQFVLFKWYWQNRVITAMKMKPNTNVYGLYLANCMEYLLARWFKLLLFRTGLGIDYSLRPIFKSNARLPPRVLANMNCAWQIRVILVSIGFHVDALFIVSAPRVVHMVRAWDGAPRRAAGESRRCFWNRPKRAVNSQAWFRRFF